MRVFLKLFQNLLSHPGIYLLIYFFFFCETGCMKIKLFCCIYEILAYNFHSETFSLKIVDLVKKTFQALHFIFLYYSIHYLPIFLFPEFFHKMSAIVWTKDNLEKVDKFLEIQTYLGSISEATISDSVVFESLKSCKDASLYPSIRRWMNHLSTFSSLNFAGKSLKLQDILSSLSSNVSFFDILNIVLWYQIAKLWMFFVKYL